MKIILVILFLTSSSLAFISTTQDSTKNQNKDKEQKLVQEQNQQKNQSDDKQVKDRNQTGNEIQSPDHKNGKGKKDVFIDKDGDGIADTRASGMSFNKVRKRTRSGGSGGKEGGSSGGQGNGK
jgi:uncharacterized protein YxeA